MKNTGKINWDELNEWVEEVKDKPGYEWLSEAYEGWEDEEILDWDKVAREWEEEKWDIKAEDAKLWLEENEERIDWDEFDEW